MIPCDLYIPYIYWCFLFAFVAPSTIDLCLYMIIYRSSSLAVKFLIILLKIYSFIAPIRTIGSPLVFQVFMLSARSERKAVLGHSLLLILEK